LLGLLLTPSKQVRAASASFATLALLMVSLALSQFPHLLFEGFIRPAVIACKRELDTNVLPVVESLVIKYARLVSLSCWG
jgi:sulfite exporter TauE/SafE